MVLAQIIVVNDYNPGTASLTFKSVCLSFFETVSHYMYVALACIELTAFHSIAILELTHREPHTSAFQVLRLRASATMSAPLSLAFLYGPLKQTAQI